MSNCRGCGSTIDLDQERLRQAVDEVLEETRPRITALPGVCPLCGHSSATPVSHRKSVQLGVLVALLLVAAGLFVFSIGSRTTARREVARAAIEQIRSNAEVERYLGLPLVVRGDIEGQVKEDETGWQEARLTIPVHGAKGDGALKVVGGRHRGAWTFTTFELLLPAARKRIDFVSGRIVDYDPDAYVEVHTEAARTADVRDATVPAARWNGEFACVSAAATARAGPTIGSCSTPGPIAALRSGPVDRFDVDLRFGKFILRQTDLVLRDGSLTVPLTRTYASQFWAHPSRVHAFGRNSTHDFDLGLVGSRNPYTHHLLILPDGDSLYSPRISRGGGYADAVYQHSETSTGFYKAITRWDGAGWDMKLADGSSVHFPESYHATTMAQGAPTRMVDTAGHVVQLIRDGQRNLREIRTPGGHWIKLHYDGEARVVRAESHTGDWVAYRYGADALLTDATFSDGRARRYTFAGELMTSVHDETGRRLIDTAYRGTKVAQQDYADGTRCEFGYVMARNNMYAREASVRLPDGSVRAFATADTVSQYIKDLSIRSAIRELVDAIPTSYRLLLLLVYVAVVTLLVRGPSFATRNGIGLLCGAVVMWNFYAGLALTLVLIAAGFSGLTFGIPDRRRARA
jgi:YD repeat-containing protein